MLGSAGGGVGLTDASTRPYANCVGLVGGSGNDY